MAYNSKKYKQAAKECIDIYLEQQGHTNLDEIVTDYAGEDFNASDLFDYAEQELLTRTGTRTGRNQP